MDKINRLDGYKNREMKKVIDFAEFMSVIVFETPSAIHIRQEKQSGADGTVIISKSKAREVSLAIYPELESELIEAIGLIKELHMTSGFNNKWHENSEIGIKTKTFLTKYKKDNEA